VEILTARVPIADQLKKQYSLKVATEKNNCDEETYSTAASAD